MNIEYHGWIALCTTQSDWSDSDFEGAFSMVKNIINKLKPEEGHDPIMPEINIFPQVVYFKGCGTEDISSVIKVFENIGKVFDKSYGELVTFESDFSNKTRYTLQEGKIKR